MDYQLCRELGFASPRHLLRRITPQERNEWIAYLTLEAERMENQRNQDDSKPREYSAAEAMSAWKAQARAAEIKRERARQSG